MSADLDREAKVTSQPLVIKHVKTIDAAHKAVAQELFDVFVIDVFLEGEDGRHFLRELRNHGFMQPVVLATGDVGIQSQPVTNFRDSFRQGPTFFFAKGEKESLYELVREATLHCDILVRALRIYHRAKIPYAGIEIGEKTYSLDDLIGLNNHQFDSAEAILSLREARTAMRESLATMLLATVERAGVD